MYDLPEQSAHCFTHKVFVWVPFGSQKLQWFFSQREFDRSEHSLHDLSQHCMHLDTVIFRCLGGWNCLNCQVWVNCYGFFLPTLHCPVKWTVINLICWFYMCYADYFTEVIQLLSNKNQCIIVYISLGTCVLKFLKLILPSYSIIWMRKGMGNYPF